MEEGEEWDLEEEDMELLKAIRSKKKLMRQQSHLNKSKNSAVMPRKARQRRMEDVTGHLGSVGVDTTGVEARGRKRTRSLVRDERDDEGDAAMDVDEPSGKRTRSKSRMLSRSRSRGNSVVRAPNSMGLKDKAQQDKTAKLARKAQMKANQFARAGEADRHSGPKLLKHLLAGKSGLGTSRSR